MLILPEAGFLTRNEDGKMSPVQVHDISINTTIKCCDHDSCPGCCSKSPPTPSPIRPSSVTNRVSDIAHLELKTEKKKCCVIL